MSTLTGRDRNHCRRPFLLDWSLIPLQLRERLDSTIIREKKGAITKLKENHFLGLESAKRAAEAIERCR